VNTAIQRSTAKAIAMHGLGLSLWIGEDLTKSIAEPLVTKKAETESKESLDIILNIGDENWATVLKYVVANKTIGLPKIIKNLETKYSIKASVKKELSKKV